MADLTTTNIYLALRKSDERRHTEDQLVLDGANVSHAAKAARMSRRGPSAI